MKKLKMGFAALIGAGWCMVASAEAILTAQETAPLKTIAEETCHAPVVFIEVSEDEDVDTRLYAVLPADQLDAGSAHIVSAFERDWLEENGCNAPAPLIMAEAQAPTPALN